MANLLADQMALRDLYDSQLRAWTPDPLPAGAAVEADGPLLRLTGLHYRAMVTYVTLDGVDGSDLDALIARQRDFFAGRGQPLEWRLHGHDQPGDLRKRLEAAGFVAQEHASVMIGPAAPLARTGASLPRGVRLREVSARADLDRIAAMVEQVWDQEFPFLAAVLERELAAGTTIVIAEAAATDGDGREVVSAGWVRYAHGTQFATLWGGSTLNGWRNRGIYRALVAYRAAQALARGFTYIHVDASAESMPVLSRCGLMEVTTTTGYVHQPARP